MSLLQLTSRASALLPPGMRNHGSTSSSTSGGAARVPADMPHAVAGLKASSVVDSGALPHDALNRVRGRALHRQLDLVQPLRFAHHGGELVLMLPETTTTLRAAPAMAHAGAREFLVHRQYELAPPPSPPTETA